VQPGHQLTDLRTKHRRQRRRLRLDERHVDPDLPQAGRHLAADEPRPDDHRVLGRSGVSTQRQALLEGAQHPDALEVRQRRNALGHQASRDDQFVVTDHVAVGQRQRLLGGVQSRRARTQQHGDVVLVVELGGLQRDLVGLGAQHFLRQWRPVIRQVVLVADDRDRSGVLGATELFGRPRRRQSTTDDDDAPTSSHVGFLTRSSRDVVRHPAFTGACAR
jgi:hypothetical protein